MFCFGNIVASRRTSLSSVPTAHELPSGAAAMVWMIFSVAAVEQARRDIPGVKVIVHPECQYEVCEAADEIGSTERIIQTIAAAPDGTSWVVGTELNLVQRLSQLFPAQQIAFLERSVCYCSTMNRIDLPHLVWTLESLVDGRVVNAIKVDPDVAHWARVALDQMLALPGVTSKD